MQGRGGGAGDGVSGGDAGETDAGARTGVLVAHEGEVEVLDGARRLDEREEGGESLESPRGVTHLRRTQRA
eukprot:4780917-Prymnesium_polylepis.1